MTAMTAAVPLLLAVLALDGGQSAPRPKDITATNVLALEAWVAFVEGHTPGRRDAAARAVSELPLETRQALYPSLPLFLSRLKGQYSPARTADGKQRRPTLASRIATTERMYIARPGYSRKPEKRHVPPAAGTVLPARNDNSRALATVPLAESP